MPFSPVMPGSTPSNPSSTAGSFSYSPTQTKSASVFMPGKGASQALINYAGGQIPQQALAQNQWLTATQAKRMFSTLGNSQLNQLAQTLNGMPKGYFSNTKALWNAAVDGSWSSNQNGTQLSPWDVVNGLQSGSIHPGQLSAGNGSGGGGGGGGTSHSSSSSTSRSFSKTSKDSADRLLDDVLANYLGRTASDAEKASFVSSLNKKEAATPTNVSTSNSSSTSSARSSVSSSSSTSHSTTGVDPQEQAIKTAQADKGYAEYQYGTTYMNAFLSALGAPVSASGTV